MPLLRSAAVLRAARPLPARAPFAPPCRHKSAAKVTALRSPTNRLRNAVRGTVLLSLAGFAYLEATDTRSSLHRYALPPLLRYLYNGDDVSSPGPERAHEVGLLALSTLHKLGLPLHERGTPSYLARLAAPVFDGAYTLATPLAISAGLDKHAECIDALFDLSPAISVLEVGCITPAPQPGSDKPRMFRLPTSQAIINRYGFNSHGADSAAVKLRTRVRRYAKEHGTTEEAVLADPSIPASLREGRLLAIQIGKMKTTAETDIDGVKRDYTACVDRLGRYADVLVVNVSSPNTPGLRALQAEAPLRDLLTAVVAAAAAAPRARKPRVLVKVSPDSDSPAEVRAISAAVREARVDGIIVANTTTRRPPQVLASPQTRDDERRIFAKEAGGLSGPVLRDRTLALVRRYRAELGPATDVWASGGLVSGRDALEARRAGANVVMAYTGMVYGGAGFFGRMAREMAALMEGS